MQFARRQALCASGEKSPLSPTDWLSENLSRHSAHQRMLSVCEGGQDSKFQKELLYLLNDRLVHLAFHW